MQQTLAVVTILHVLPAVFWAGSTFVLARTGAAGAERLAAPQLGAATIAILSGGVLWSLLHRGAMGGAEQVLAFAAACALAAGGLQAMSWPVVQRLGAAQQAAAVPLRRRIALSQRIAAALLVVAVIGMAGARYV